MTKKRSPWPAAMGIATINDAKPSSEVPIREHYKARPPICKATWLQGLAYDVIEKNNVTVPLSAIPAAKNTQSDPPRPSTRPFSQNICMPDTPGRLTRTLTGGETLVPTTSGSPGHHGVAAGIGGQLTCLHDRPAGGGFESALLRLCSDTDESGSGQ